MDSHRAALMLGLVFLLANRARADRVTSDYDHTVDFSRYHTFMWIREPEPREPFMKERIMAAVNMQLIARGMRAVSDGADLAIGANIETEQKHTWETYYDGLLWESEGWVWKTEKTEKTHEVGTLTVDLFDAQSRRLVWQGVGTDTLSPRPEKRTRDCDKEIEKIFKDFPVGTRQ